MSDAAVRLEENRRLARNRGLDLAERVRQDHMWIYALIGQCRDLQVKQKEARKAAGYDPLLMADSKLIVL